MVSNNIRNYSFSVDLLVFILSNLYRSICCDAYKASFLVFAISMHSVFHKLKGQCVSMEAMQFQ